MKSGEHEYTMNSKKHEKTRIFDVGFSKEWNRLLIQYNYNKLDMHGKINNYVFSSLAIIPLGHLCVCSKILKKIFVTQYIEQRGKYLTQLLPTITS